MKEKIETKANELNFEIVNLEQVDDEIWSITFLVNGLTDEDKAMCASVGCYEYDVSLTGTTDELLIEMDHAYDGFRMPNV